MLPDELRSRKLAGLLIVIGALFVLFTIYIVASIWVNVSDTVMTAITTSITGMGLSHQAAQATQDRAQAYSPNYPNVPRPPDVP